MSKHFTRRGSALILTIFLLIVLEFIGLGFLSRVHGEMAQSTRDVTSFYVLKSALADTREWCRNRQQLELLDSALAALPTGTDPTAPPSMRTYYQRDSSAATSPVPSGWRWRVRMFPDRFTSGNSAQQGSNPIRCYRIQIDAIDTHTNGSDTVSRRAVAWLQQEPLNPGWRYNDSPSDLWLNLQTFRIRGPFETNARLRLSIPAGYNWDDLGTNQANAPFQDTVEYATVTGSPSMDTIEYNGYTASRLPYDTGSGLPVGISTPGKNRYDRLGKLGKAGFQVKPIFVMPEVSEYLSEAAWGDDTIPTPSTGLNINPGTVAEARSVGGVSVSLNKAVNGLLLAGPSVEGVYMQVGNDAQNPIDVTALRGANNDNYSIKIRQGGIIRRVTETYSQTTLDPGGSWKLNGVTVTGPLVLPAPPSAPAGQEVPGYVIVQNNSLLKEYTVMKGSGNGLLYSLSNINGIEGTNKGRHTFGVDQMNNKEIRVTGEILRSDVTQGNDVPAGATRDQVGLVGYAVRFATKRTDPTTGLLGDINRSVWTAADPMYLYASIFAGRPSDPNSTSGEIGGGVGTIGYNDSSFGAGTFRLYGSMTENIRQAKGQFNPDTGVGTAGMNYQFYYDSNLANIQPPYFPAKTTFLVQGWNDEIVQLDATL